MFEQEEWVKDHKGFGLETTVEIPQRRWAKTVRVDRDTFRRLLVEAGYTPREDA